MKMTFCYVSNSIVDYIKDVFFISYIFFIVKTTITCCTKLFDLARFFFVSVTRKRCIIQIISTFFQRYLSIKEECKFGWSYEKEKKKKNHLKILKECWSDKNKTCLNKYMIRETFFRYEIAQLRYPMVCHADILDIYFP